MKLSKKAKNVTICTSAVIGVFVLIGLSIDGVAWAQDKWWGVVHDDLDNRYDKKYLSQEAAVTMEKNIIREQRVYSNKKSLEDIDYKLFILRVKKNQGAADAVDNADLKYLEDKRKELIDEKKTEATG